MSARKGTPSLKNYLCPACGGRLWLEAAEVRSETGQAYRLLRCASCGIRRLDCHLESAELKSIYGDNYYSQNVMSAPSFRTRVRSYMSSCPVSVVGTLYRRLSTTWLPVPQPGRNRLLDVGCGDGAAMHAASRLGWLAEGCEVSDEACASARLRGFHCYGGDWERQLPRDSFDFVLLSHVLEHLEDPVMVLRSLRDALRRGGTLLVAVPNSDGSLGRTFGEAWLANPAPEHIWHFEYAQLRRIVEEAGYVVRGVRRQPVFSGTLAPHVLRRQWEYAAGQGWPRRRIAGAFVRLAFRYGTSLLGQHRSPVGEGYSFALECQAI